MKRQEQLYTWGECFLIGFDSMFTIKSMDAYEEIKTIQKSLGSKVEAFYAPAPCFLTDRQTTHTAGLGAGFWVQEGRTELRACRSPGRLLRPRYMVVVAFVWWWL